MNLSANPVAFYKKQVIRVLLAGGNYLGKIITRRTYKTREQQTETGNKPKVFVLKPCQSQAPGGLLWCAG